MSKKNNNKIICVQSDEIIKYDNDLNILDLSKLTSLEINLFFSLIGRLQNKQNEKLTFNSAEIKEFLGAEYRGNERMFDILIKFKENIFKLDFTKVKKVQGKRYIGMYNLFEQLEAIIDEESNSLDYFQVKVSPIFGYLINNIEGNYTQFELSILRALRSTFSKHLFRLLKQFQHTGVFYNKIDNLIAHLGLSSYTTKDAIKIIKTSICELKQIQAKTNDNTNLLFKFIDCEFIKDKKDKRKYSHVRINFNIANVSINNNKTILSLEDKDTSYNTILNHFFNSNNVFFKHQSKEDYYYKFREYDKSNNIYTFDIFINTELFGLHKPDKNNEIHIKVGIGKDFQSHKSLCDFLIKSAYVFETINPNNAIKTKKIFKFRKEQLRAFIDYVEKLDMKGII